MELRGSEPLTLCLQTGLSCPIGMVSRINRPKPARVSGRQIPSLSVLRPNSDDRARSGHGARESAHDGYANTFGKCFASCVFVDVKLRGLEPLTLCLQRRFDHVSQLLDRCSGPVFSPSSCRSTAVVFAPIWHANGTRASRMNYRRARRFRHRFPATPPAQIITVSTHQ